MKRQFKLSTSILALALSMSVSTSFATQEQPDCDYERKHREEELACVVLSNAAALPPVPSVAPPAGVERLSNLEGSNSSHLSKVSTFFLNEERTAELKFSSSPDLMVTELTDTYDDSGSFFMKSQGEAKLEIQRILSKLKNHHEVRRILQLDGGGARGWLEIMKLSVLEEIFNASCNEAARIGILTKLGKASTDRLYIRDLFDVGAGTSTGSIIIAGLFSKGDHSAIDIAKLYTRYGHKIFDENRRLTLPWIDVALTSAIYNNEGLWELLVHYFGNDSLRVGKEGDLYNEVYISVMNETRRKIDEITSRPKKGDDRQLHKTLLRDAVHASCSAPMYFEALKLVAGKKEEVFSDGGTAANNSAFSTFQDQKRYFASPFEIYSFGTGLVPDPAVRALDSGALEVKTIFMNTMVAVEKSAVEACKNEIEAITSQLWAFYRINAKLEEGMDRLDNTSRTSVEYLKKKAISVTLGPVFVDMVRHLGFQMPQADEMEMILQNIDNKLDALKSKKYSELDKYEKEFVIKKILDLDFTFYQKGFYQDPATGEVLRMTSEEKNNFLKNLLKDIADKKRAGDGFVSRLWGMVSKSQEDDILEFVPRCEEFHHLSYGKILLNDEQFSRLKEGYKFTQAQLKQLSPDMKINGEGFWNAGSKEPETPANQLATILLTTFKGLCENESAKYKYPYDNVHYIQLPAIIFWKNILNGIEGHLTKGDLTQVYGNLENVIKQIKDSRSYTSFGKDVRSTRYDVLLAGLNTYMDKYVSEQSIPIEAAAAMEAPVGVDRGDEKQDSDG
jgi:patatin-like phospholipase/acyl hydrolase